jgi:HD superfamily phosphodiesterase
MRLLRRRVRVRLLRQAASLADDASHAERVWQNALRILERDPNCVVDADTTEAACRLCTAGRLLAAPGESVSDACGRVAEELLRSCDLDVLVWPVCEVILACLDAHHAPDTPEARVVRDALLLEDLGATGVLRSIIESTLRGTPALVDPSDPAANGRPLMPQAFLVDAIRMRLQRAEYSLCTEAGRRIAAERREGSRAFVSALLDELVARGSEGGDDG